MIKLIIFSCLFVSFFHQGLSFNRENVDQQLKTLRLKRSSGQSSAHSSASADSSSVVSTGTGNESTNPFRVLSLTMGELASMMESKGTESALTSVIEKLKGIVAAIDAKSSEAVGTLINSNLSPTKAIKLLTSTGSGLSKILSNQASSSASSSSQDQRKR